MTHSYDSSCFMTHNESLTTFAWVAEHFVYCYYRRRVVGQVSQVRASADSVSYSASTMVSLSVRALKISKKLWEVVGEVLWYPKYNFEVVTRVTPDL